MVRPMAGTGPIAHALEAASIDDVKNPTARTFRAFAEKTGGDLKALAACIRGSREPLTREMVGSIACPVLVATGTEDVIGGPGRRAGGADPRRRGPADPAPRPHAGRRRQGLQGRRARVSAAAGRRARQEAVRTQKEAPAGCRQRSGGHEKVCHRSRRQRNAGAALTRTTYALSGDLTVAVGTTYVVGNLLVDIGNPVDNLTRSIQMPAQSQSFASHALRFAVQPRHF